MISVKKAFTLPISEVSRKFRVENNNLDIADLIANSGLQAKKIKDFASAHRNERNRKETVNDSFRYVQISDIDVNLGRIKSYRTFQGDQAPNNARRIMSHGDILISTRRPTRGAIVAVPEDFDSHICTVFFTTLKILDWNEVDPWYLALFLRTSLGRFQFQSLITETAYPVISDADVLDMTVLLPDIDKQRAIAAAYAESVGSFFNALNEAYRSISNARQEIENFVLRDEAEFLDTPVFGLTTAIEEEDVDVSED
jgi:Type I restriction modification DNA specificity domain